VRQVYWLDKIPAALIIAANKIALLSMLFSDIKKVSEIHTTLQTLLRRGPETKDSTLEASDGQVSQ
jgi:hypothetical protein